MTDEKPKFEELTLMTLPGEELVFNAQRVGPMNFAGLRNADYEKGFRMLTMPELVPLVYASLKNKEYKTAKNVLKTLRKPGISTNTRILYIPRREGMFVQDNPELKDGRIAMNETAPSINEKALEKKLGTHTERGVIFSDDKSIRFTPYNFKRRSQTHLELSINTGIIALVGGEENAEKLAKVSEHYKSKPFFQTLLKEDFDSPQTKATGLKVNRFFVSWLNVSTDQDEDFGSSYSFGEYEGTPQEIKQKKK